MATNAPTTRCMICGQPHEYEVVPHYQPPGSPVRFGPTDWQQKPHECPPGAVEAWIETLDIKTDREPFFKKIGT
jgi:hypothetical protein